MTTTSSYESLSHSKWDCKYHIVFIPKGRKKELYGKIRKYLGPVFHELARQRESEIIEGHRRWIRRKSDKSIYKEPSTTDSQGFDESGEF